MKFRKLPPTVRDCPQAFAYNECMVGFAAGPVLYVGAVTRVMDGACYSQVICIIFTVATKLPWEPS